MNMSLQPLKFIFYSIFIYLSLFSNKLLKADDQIQSILFFEIPTLSNAFTVKHPSNTPIKYLNYPGDPIVQLSGDKETLNQIYKSNNVISFFEVASNSLAIRKGSGGIIEYRYFLINNSNKSPLYFSKNKVEFSCLEPNYIYKPNTFEYQILNSNIKLKPSQYSKQKPFFKAEDDSLSLWISNICKG